MRSIPNNAPSNVAALDDRDPNAGNVSHEYGVQYGGPGAVLRIQFQHGPRGVEGSAPGIYDDDLLAIIEDRMASFQSGPFASPESQTALEHIRAAREALGLRVARRIAQGVLGVNAAHTVPAPPVKRRSYTDLGKVELSDEDAAKADAMIEQAEKDIAAKAKHTCVDCRHRHVPGVRCGEDAGPSLVGERVTCGCTSNRTMASGAR